LDDIKQHGCLRGLFTFFLPLPILLKNKKGQKGNHRHGDGNPRGRLQHRWSDVTIFDILYPSLMMAQVTLTPSGRLPMASSTQYEPKSLPFHKKGLVGISEKTLDIHYDKLYIGYVNKMKEVATRLQELRTAPSLTGNQTHSELRSLRKAETFATNGVYLHEAYFQSLGGEGKSEGELARALTEKWGSVEAFQTSFTESGMAMRGWVVLAWDAHLARLKIYGCDAHNEGGIWGCFPVLVLDVYEHAYFADYGADRKAYIADFWKNLNWKTVNNIFERVAQFTL
jgi:Fe-Mn family superoxide dismutase